MQQIIDLIQAQPILANLAVLIIGIFAGRIALILARALPTYLEVHWRYECHEFLQMPMPAHPASLWQTIIRKPTKTATFKRLPILETLCAVLFVSISYKFGFSLQTGAGCLLLWALLTQGAIDFAHEFIPDQITLPMLWLGLLLSIIPVFASTHDAIIGAVAGYTSLWLINKIFYLIRGKQGMGQGDFKLLAMLGAWLGWQALPLVILAASVLGSIVGLWLLFTKRLRSTRIPFGPFLAIAGYIVFMLQS